MRECATRRRGELLPSCCSLPRRTRSGLLARLARLAWLPPAWLPAVAPIRLAREPEKLLVMLAIDRWAPAELLVSELPLVCPPALPPATPRPHPRYLRQLLFKSAERCLY